MPINNKDDSLISLALLQKPAFQELERAVKSNQGYPWRKRYREKDRGGRRGREKMLYFAIKALIKLSPN